MNLLSAIVIGACVGFLSLEVHARNTSQFISAKSSLEYGILPNTIGNVRKSEAWFSFQTNTKWTPKSFEKLRFEFTLAGEFLVLSPSTAASTTQTLGAPYAGQWNRSGSPHYLEDQELFAEYQYGKTIISVGSRTLRWGIVDFYDPLDQVNSRRMERPTQTSKRGEWMLHWERREPNSTVGGITFEAFLIPFKREAILPSQTSAWLPRQLYIPNRPEAEFILPTAVEYIYRDRDVFDTALQWNFGARALWRPSENEIIFQYDEGSSSFPSIRPSVSGPLIGILPNGRNVIQADPLIQLTEVYYRERHYGASLTKALATNLIRMQFAKTEAISQGRELASDRSDLSFALEKPVNIGKSGHVTLLAQGFKNLLENKTGGTDLASFSTFFDRALAAGLRFAVNDTTTATLGALRSLTEKSGTIIQTSVTFDIGSNATIDLNWTWFEANLDSPIGPYKDNDGGSLKVTASF